jgi:hypothetical protein
MEKRLVFSSWFHARCTFRNACWDRESVFGRYEYGMEAYVQLFEIQIFVVHVRSVLSNISGRETLPRRNLLGR